MTIFLFAVFGYLLGSIPFSYLVPKFAAGIDIRQYGSGNAGSTNVFRKLGTKVAAIAFAGDFLKGVAAGYMGYRLGGELPALIAGAFAMIGHCYPVWIGFKGGKGVAVSGGVILGLNPLVFILLLPVQIFFMFTTRYVSLASILTAISFPIVSFFTGSSPTFVMMASFISAFVIFKHNSNIKKLLNGTESKIGTKKS